MNNLTPYLAAVALLPAAASVPAAESSARPNILWLVIEDTSPGFVGPYPDSSGLARTPTADRLAKHGIVFDRCYTAPVCAPSRSTLATGRFAHGMGTQHMRSTQPLPEGVKFFTAYLRETGYFCTNNAKTDYNTSTPWASAWDENSTEAHWRHRQPGQPFFAMFTFTQSHEQFLQTRRPLRTDPAKVSVPAYLPDLPAVRADIAQFYDNVALADAAAGEVLAQLEADGLLDDTIVFYFADNGGVIAGSKRFLNENGTRVPLVVRFPAKFAHLAPSGAGTRLGELVHFVDFGPTALSLVGATIDPQFQGRAFAGVRRTPAPEFTFMGRDRMDERYDMVRAVTDGRYHYVRYYYPDRPMGQRIDYLWKQASMREWELQYRAGTLRPEQRRFFEPKAVEELYECATDPDNVRNLASDPAQRERLLKFRAALRSHQLTVRDTGLLPEPMMIDLAAGGSPAAFAADDARYPLARVLDVVDHLQLDAADGASLAANARDPNPVVRYWTAVAAMNMSKLDVSVMEPLLADTDPTVRVTAAEAILRRGPHAVALRVIEDAVVQTERKELRLAALNALDRCPIETPKNLRPILGQLVASTEFGSFDYYLARAAWPLLAR